MCVYRFLCIIRSAYIPSHSQTQRMYVRAEGKIVVCLFLVLAIGQFGAKAPNGIALATGHVEQLC